MGGQVSPDHLGCRTGLADDAGLEPQRPRAQTRERIEIMTDEDDGATLDSHLPHPTQALALKFDVSDRENLIDHEDVGLQVSGDREGQPKIHTTGIALHGSIEEPLNAGEFDDLFK